MQVFDWKWFSEKILIPVVVAITAGIFALWARKEHAKRGPHKSRAKVEGNSNIVIQNSKNINVEKDDSQT